VNRESHGLKPWEDVNSSISRSQDTSRITSTPPTTRPLASKMGAEETATGTLRP